jgi:hypothetical protein
MQRRVAPGIGGEIIKNGISGQAEKIRIVDAGEV